MTSALTVDKIRYFCVNKRKARHCEVYQPHTIIKHGKTLINIFFFFI